MRKIIYLSLYSNFHGCSSHCYIGSIPWDITLTTHICIACVYIDISKASYRVIIRLLIDPFSPNILCSLCMFSLYYKTVLGLLLPHNITHGHYLQFKIEQYSPKDPVSMCSSYLSFIFSFSIFFLSLFLSLLLSFVFLFPFILFHFMFFFPLSFRHIILMIFLNCLHH